MKYSRILLKLSGESLSGDRNHGIDFRILGEYTRQIIEVINTGCEVAVVIGGGNIFRGMAGEENGFDRVTGDQMGMLATVINSLALETEIRNQGGKSKVYTSIRMEPVGELYIRNRVIDALKAGTVCILAGGTGNPFFTTDSAAALRSVEIGADILLKGTRVDGVYTSDPEKDPTASKFDILSFEEAIDKRLGIMDTTAFTMCRENNMPIVVFNINHPGNLMKIVDGQIPGTLICN